MSKTVECQKWVLIYDYIIIQIPKIIFFIAGPINFYKVRSMAFNRVVKYSKLFKLKLNILFIMIAINIGQIIYIIVRII